jgi:hypothetical protein
MASRKRLFLHKHFILISMGATISERKVHTIELLAQLEDENLLALIESLLSEAQPGDWADTLSEKEQADIAEGLSDLEAGNVESFSKIS